MEENIALARRFLLEHFVSRGMVIDFAVHAPEKEDGGIRTLIFHVLAPIRPIEPNGTWGWKQHRVYALDEDGNRIRDADGNFVFHAVATTDWGSPVTLEYWREQWAAMCNAKFEEKGLAVRIDHRSYVRQGLDLLPTVHEGATVRAMERKGIPTDKGEFNRWIKATNALIREVKRKISTLLDWIQETKAELSKPQESDLVSPAERLLHWAQCKVLFPKRKGTELERNERSLSLSARKRYLHTGRFARTGGEPQQHGGAYEKNAGRRNRPYERDPQLV